MVHHHHVHIPRRYQKLFQDAISVTIPLDMKKTADLGIAMKRTRAKRIQKLHECFPSLVVQEQQQQAAASDAAGQPMDMDDDDNNNNSDAGEEEKKESDSKQKRKQNDHMPQRDQYASVLDYLEAKYVQGVMIDDEEVNDNEDDDEDDKGSVYESDNSFLDDSLLKRDVTEQVLSQSIQTKKLNNNADDDEEEDDFFVNVGNLEVEDFDNLMDYDPLADEAKENKAATTKKKAKRKRATSTGDSSTTSSSPKNKKAASKKNSPASPSSPKKKESTTKTTKSPSNKSPASKKEAMKELTVEEKQHLQTLKQKALQRKQTMEQFYNQVMALIQQMTPDQLPRKKKKKMVKLSIVVPPGKQAGDNITFSNPHVPGQKLRVKVPKDSVPGGKFVVSVPVPPKDDDDVVNDNKFSREFQDLLDDYSQAFDEWTHAEADSWEADPTKPKKFLVHQSRMNKFEEMLKVFPKNLATPVDAAYMRKIVRRARQNKQKRSKTAAKLVMTTAEEQDGGGGKEKQQQEEKQDTAAAATTTTTTEEKKVEEAAAPPAAPKVSPTMELVIPGKGTTFPKFMMNHEDFTHH